VGQGFGEICITPTAEDPYAPRSIPLEKLFFSANRLIDNLEQKFDLLNNDLYNSQLMSWNVFIF
jgi:hypothetical protein